MDKKIISNINEKIKDLKGAYKESKYPNYLEEIKLLEGVLNLLKGG